MMQINKVAVIGAGVMGAGIAAQVANAGVPVVLLDIVPAGADNRNAVAEGAVAKMLKTEPAPFMSKAAAKLVTTGNIEDHLDLLRDCDWIVEVVVEKLDVKQALYKKIDAHRKPEAIVSSNTSTIPLANLVEGMPQSFAEKFIITHFFNPPRYMRLLELVTSPLNSADTIKTVTDFCDYKLGKGVVVCKDRPGFIANRLGVYWLQSAVVLAFEHKLQIEEADAIIGKPLGIPKTGVFGLLDLIGLDLMPHINASMASALPREDAFHGMNQPLPLVERMIKEGYTGRKGKGGFYRLNREKGKLKEAIDLATGDYRAQARARVEAVDEAGKDLKKLLTHDSAPGRYAWDVVRKTLCYAAALVGDAADDIVSIDEAMRLGYAWKWGPFELLDKIGVDWFVEKLHAEGGLVPPILQAAAGKTFYRVENGKRQALTLNGDYVTLERPEGVLLLADIKLTQKPVLKNASASVWDIGDGVLCFEFTSMMNSLDADIVMLLNQTIQLVQKNHKALVIYNEGSNFTVGANLGLALFAANVAAWSEIEQLVGLGQFAYKALKYAPFPVVSAPSGMALGGGCEILLHSDAIQAHAESYIGLVEVGVGLIPGWGGCKEMLARWQAHKKTPKGPMPAVAQVFEYISTARVAKSAAEARDMLILRDGDGVTMNRNRLLFDAKAKALKLVENYQPPEKPVYRLPGPSGKLALKMAVDGFAKLGKATKHDIVVSEALANILTGGETEYFDELNEDKILELERQNFMKLVRNPDSLARIEHMLETGKPLRN
ncbi:3-hydroxyacyl-CoA dehydrogenase [Rhodoblastus acidophilus]|nr:3-hydroxyacyl-CoA dehydrogenase [Rhodoblastus acidophilus]RAI23813.1 3-hydroxyacyl-CoA dehydrogenase [Rhodoblastus acidophilus]